MSSGDSRNDKHESLYLTTEQYMYRRLADMCLQYMTIDRRLGKTRDRAWNLVVSRELANIFESIRSFVAEEQAFPDILRYPPLDEWTIRDSKDPTLYVLHPRAAKDYIMAVYREIRRQQSKQDRDVFAIAEKFRLV